MAFDISLDIIKPIGFSLQDKYLKRAGLDYWQYLNLNVHEDFDIYKRKLSSARIIGFSKEGGIPLNSIKFDINDCLLFGREDNGLPNSIKDKCSINSVRVCQGFNEEK